MLLVVARQLHAAVATLSTTILSISLVEGFSLAYCPAETCLAISTLASVQMLNTRLLQETHSPIDAWHKRYGELKARHPCFLPSQIPSLLSHAILAL